MLAGLWAWLTGSEAEAEPAPVALPTPVARSEAGVRAALDVLQDRRGYGEFKMGSWDIELMRDAIAAADAVDYPNGLTAK